jgi:hypothetical protein
MEMNMNYVYHKYIMKVILFGIFLYKGKIRKRDKFEKDVKDFVEKRLPWKVGLVIDTGKKLPKAEERTILIDSILNGIETNYLSSVMISFTTPLKRVIMLVDLKQEEKYEKFIYS